MERHPVLLALLALLLTGCNNAAPAPAVAPRALRMNTSSRVGNFYPIGRAMADVIEANLPGTRIEMMQTAGGAVGNVEALEDGESDLALSFTNVAYAAFLGGLHKGAKPFTNLRGIAVLDLAPLHLVVGPHSGIHTVGDLRGRTVNIGGPTSGASLAVEIVLTAYGSDTNSFRSVTLGYEEGVNHVLDDSLDALFVLGNYPSNVVERATRGGARLLPLDSVEIDQVRANYLFFLPALIPANGYSGVTTPVRTVGVESILLCRLDLDEELVYQLTKTLFDVQDNRAPVPRPDNWSSLKQGAATPIPLHAGAARYYRERELFP